MGGIAGLGLNLDPYATTDEGGYPEGLEDVVTLMARATARYGRYGPDTDAIAMLQAWITLGRPPRISEIDWDAQMPEPEDPLVDEPDVGTVLGFPGDRPD